MGAAAGMTGKGSDPEPDPDDFQRDPMDSWNPALQTMKARYLLGKADAREREDYWSERQNKKLKYLPKGTRHECTARCELELLVVALEGIDGAAALGALGSAAVRLSIRINLLPSKKSFGRVGQKTGEAYEEYVRKKLDLSEGFNNGGPTIRCSERKSVVRNQID